MRVLVTGITGTYRNVKPSETGIDAVVWKEWNAYLVHMLELSTIWHPQNCLYAQFHTAVMKI